MKEIVFLLEEESAKVLIENIIYKIICKGEIKTRFIVFQGKSDLEKQMVLKLRAYNNKEAKFIILRDQDSADCSIIKNNLTQLARNKTRIYEKNR